MEYARGRPMLWPCELDAPGSNPVLLLGLIRRSLKVWPLRFSRGFEARVCWDAKRGLKSTASPGASVARMTLGLASIVRYRSTPGDSGAGESSYEPMFCRCKLIEI